MTRPRGPEPLTIAAYARSRRARGLPGGSKQAVHAALRSGRITKTPDGKIDPERADADWLANSPRSPGSPVPSGAGTLAALQRDRLATDCARLRLAIERERSGLVDLAELRPLLAGVFATLRESLAGAGSRVAPDVAALEDLPAIAELVRRENAAAINAAIEQIRTNHDNTGGTPGKEKNE